MLTVLSLVLTGLFACTDPDEDLDGHPASVDCDDADDTTHPDAPERCDGLDNDCDGLVDEDILGSPTWYADADADGYGDPDVTLVACRDPGVAWVEDRADCDDTSADVSPEGIEVCNDADDDCNGWVDDDPLDASTFFEDDDGDGFGDPDSSLVACTAIPGFVSDASDCDDRVDTVHPGAVEACDAVDNDCDDVVDEDCPEAD